MPTGHEINVLVVVLDEVRFVDAGNLVVGLRGLFRAVVGVLGRRRGARIGRRATASTAHPVAVVTVVLEEGLQPLVQAFVHVAQGGRSNSVLHVLAGCQRLQGRGHLADGGVLLALLRRPAGGHGRSGEPEREGGGQRSPFDPGGTIRRHVLGVSRKCAIRILAEECTVWWLWSLEMELVVSWMCHCVRCYVHGRLPLPANLRYARYLERTVAPP